MECLFLLLMNKEQFYHSLYQVVNRGESNFFCTANPDDLLELTHAEGRERKLIVHIDETDETVYKMADLMKAYCMPQKQRWSGS
jgi:hypothetical protein